MFGNWISLGASTALLAIESQEVIALRFAKLARGDRAARREAHLMVHEKFLTLSEAVAKAARGSSSDDVVALYRNKVRENLVRLAQ